MPRKPLIALALIILAQTLFADELPQAQRLEQYGMVSLAAQAYEKLGGDNPEAIQGLLRIRLAQKKPQEVLKLLEGAKGLSEQQRALYTSLAQMQMGQGANLDKLDKTQLSAQQADWALMAEGLQAYQAGDLDKAAALWKQISQTPEAFTYALALLPKDADAPNSPMGKKARKALEKRIKRLRRDDWDVFKYYLWGVSQTQGPQTAADLMRGRTDKFDFGQPQLLMAYLLPEGSNERHDLLFDVIKNTKSTQKLRALAITMAAAGQSISLVCRSFSYYGFLGGS